MISSTLLSILSKFSQKEFKEFGEFIISPFFNKNDNVVTFYNYLRKFYPDFKDKKLEKEDVYRKIFDKGKYNDGFMRTVIFNMVKLAEDYLVYINFTKDKLNRGIGLLEELNERKLEKAFLKYYSEIEKEITSISYQGPEYFYKKYQLENQMETYLDWSKFKNKNFKNYSKKTSSYVNDELTSYYLTKALNHYRFMLDKAKYEQIEYNFDFIDHILNYLTTKDNYFKNKIKIKLHLYEILILKENKAEYYYILKEILINSADSLNQDDRYSLHNVLQAFCTHKAYSGEKGYIKERFELYKICIEQKLYGASVHIYFDDLMFGNIAMTAVSLKEFDWTESFINEYESMLSPENREVAVNFSRARLGFARGKYEETLKYLNSLKNIKHIQYKLPIRDLTLMAYYELSDFSQTFYLIDNYRHFLTNNKSSLSEVRFDRISTFLKFFARLVKIKEKNNRTELKKLKQEIDARNNLLEKNWLQEKVKELT